MTSLENATLIDEVTNKRLRSTLKGSFLKVIFATVLKDTASKNGVEIAVLSCGLLSVH